MNKITIKRNKKFLRTCSVFSVLFLLIISCSQKSSVSSNKALPPDQEAYEKLPSLGIIPTQPFSRSDVEGKSVCPICGSGLTAGPIGKKDINVFFDILFYQVDRSYRFRTISRRTLDSVLSNTHSIQDKCQKARDVQIDFLLTSTLFRYEQRVGDEFGVTRPASVAFDLHLFETKKCQCIWTNRYIETQQALTDNILDVKKTIQRRARWVTVDELAREGVVKSISKIPAADIAPHS